MESQGIRNTTVYLDDDVVRVPFSEVNFTQSERDILDILLEGYTLRDARKMGVTKKEIDSIRKKLKYNIQ